MFMVESFTPESIAIDGKVLRGSAGRDENGKYTPGQKIVSAFLPECDFVLDVELSENGDELSAGRILLERLDLDGKIVTADAGFTHMVICAEITRQGWPRNSSHTLGLC